MDGVELFKSALEKDDINEAKRLVNTGAVGVNAKDKDGDTLLYLTLLTIKEDTPPTIKEERIEFAKFLVSKGADPNAKNSYEDTALHIVAVKGLTNFAVFLVFEKEVDVNARNKYNKTPLYKAVVGRRKDIMQMLIDKLADPNIPDDQGNTPLHRLASKGNDIELAEVLIKGGADINAKNYKDSMPLHEAVRNENFRMVEFLISKGAYLYAKDMLGRTPLDLARSDRMRQILMEAMKKNPPSVLDVMALNKPNNGLGPKNGSGKTGAGEPKSGFSRLKRIFKPQNGAAKVLI